MLNPKKRISGTPSLFSFFAVTVLLAASACTESTGNPVGSECVNVSECASGLICYSGTCRTGQNTQLSCTVDIDVDIDNDGLVDIQGCNPVGTDPNSELAVVCEAGTCRFAARDTPNLAADAGTSTAADAGQQDAGVAGNPDAAMMGPTDAAFVAATACNFPMNLPMNEDQNAPTLMGPPTVNAPSISSGDTVTINISLAEGCGVAKAKAVLGADPAPGTMNAPTRMLFDLTPGNGIENGMPMAGQSRITISGALSPCLRNTAQVRLLELHLEDFGGNTRYYEPDPSSGVLQQGAKKGDVLTNAGISTVNFGVAGTGATQTPPLEVSSISAANGPSGIDVTATVSSQSADCHYQRLEVTATTSTGQSLTGFAEVAQAGQGDEITATINVPACAQNRVWNVTSVKVVDAALREVMYSSANGGNFLRGDGLLSNIGAVSVTLMGGTDSESPDMTDIQTEVVAETDGTAVSFNVHATDDVCQLGQTQVLLVHESGSPSFSQTLTEGGDTLSTGCLPIPMCAKAGVYKLNTISAMDKGTSSVTLTEAGASYSVSKTDSSTSGWAPGSIITIQHN